MIGRKKYLGRFDIFKLMESFISWIAEWLLEISNYDPMIIAFYAGLFVALMTSLGSLAALFFTKITQRGVDFSLSFAAGIMIVASFTSLILPAIDLTDSFIPAGVGIALGIGFIHMIDRFAPHEHIIKGYEGPKEFKHKLKKVWLLIIAMIIHNLPEGLAVGTSIIYNVEVGIITAIAIGIQDIPEGAVVSLPLASIQHRKTGPIALGILSGIAEMIMVLVGAYFFTYFNWLLPYGLGMAGGAMLYVTVKEVIPELYRERENEILITLGFFIGFYIMLFLDSMLG